MAASLVIITLVFIMTYVISGHVVFSIAKQKGVSSVSAKEDVVNTQQPTDTNQNNHDRDMGSSINIPIKMFTNDLSMTPKQETSNTGENNDSNNIKQDINDDHTTVIENEAIDDAYFENTLFIGNSRTKGLYLASAPKGATFYAHEGLLVDNALTKKFIKDGSQTKLSITEALEEQTFDYVYIMFGTNELGWVSLDIFIEYYKNIIQAVRQHNQDVTIYVQSILPVSEKKSKSTQIYTNANILKFNAKIMAMCKDENVYYLDTWHSVANAKGVLPEEASSDGIHLNKKYTDIWLDYIRKHTITEIKS